MTYGSWFSLIKAASMEFQPVKRIAWVEVEEIPFKLWSDEFDKEEDQDDNNVNEEEVKEQNPDLFRDDSDDERIPVTLFQEEVQGVNNMEEGLIE
nr:nucleotide-binding alpha-beta plait domain-containing protein [Tanacetum cinerariifolium]